MVLVHRFEPQLTSFIHSQYRTLEIPANHPTAAIDGQHFASFEVLFTAVLSRAACVVGESVNVAGNVEVPTVQYYIIPL